MKQEVPGPRDWRAADWPSGWEAIVLGALGLGTAALSHSLAAGPIFQKYPNLAAALRRGTLTAEQISDASPAYLLLNAAAPPSVVRGLQVLLAGLGIILVHAVARSAGGRAAAWIAALALALAQPWLVYASVLEPDLAIGFLGLAGVASLVLGDPGRLRPPLLAGTALGLSVALRPSAVPLAIGMVAWLLVDRKGRRPALQAIVFAVAFGVLALLPGAALRGLGGREWRATMSAGQVFHQGHRPEGTGLGATYPTLLVLMALQDAGTAGHLPDLHHELYREFARAAEGGAIDAPEAERFWARKVLGYASREPVAFLRQLARKLVFIAAAPAGDADVPDVQALLQRAPWSGVPLRWITLAGLAGLLLSLRRGRVAALLALWVGASVAVFLVFYFQSRYAVTVLPAWCALAGMGAARLVASWRAPRRVALLCGVAVLPFLALLPGWVRDEGRMLERTAAVPVRSEAPALRAQGRWEEALDRHLDEQAALPDWTWPWSPNGYALRSDSPEQAALAADRARSRWRADGPVDAYLLAVLEAAAGRCDVAIPLARRASEAGFHAAVADTALDPDLLVSDCLVGMGRREDALREVERSLSKRPGTLDGLARAASARLRGEPWGGSGPDPVEVLFALHDPASAHYALSRARRVWGDPAGALAEADALARLLPRARPFAEFERARCLLDLGQPVEALRAYARSMVIRYPMHGARRFDEPVRALVDASPDDPGVARFALAHWSSRGELDEIRALLRRHPGLAAGPATGR
jgi:tetratricopeptide (TPR) repeat protein